MKRLELKLELLRSNPLFLRQFAVPEEFTVSQLYQVVRILLGWEEKEAYRFWRGKEAFVPKDLIKEMFHGETFVYFQVGTGDEKWVFRLSNTGLEAQDGDLPSVSRYRGNNPPRDCNGVKKYNELQKYWENGGWNYYNSFMRSHPESDYYFSVSAVNRMFRMTFGTEEDQRLLQTVSKFDFASAINGKELLEQMTVADMKQMAGLLHLRVPSGLLKNELIEYLSGRMSDGKILDSLLQMMTLGQYRIFQRICEGNASWDDLETRLVAEILGDRGLVPFPYFDPLEEEGQEIRVTRELLSAYVEWMEDDSEKAFLEQALLRTTLLGSLRLYGCITKSAWKALVYHWRSNTCREEDLERIWDSASRWIDPELYDCTEKELIFRSDIMRKTDATMLSALAQKADRYVPTLEELQKIDEEGLRFPAREEKMLRTFLNQNVWLTEGKTGWYLSQFYQSLQGMGDVELICRWFSVQEGMRRKKVLKDLGNLLRVVGSAVRRIGYFGHTEQEWAKLQRKRR